MGIEDICSQLGLAYCPEDSEDKEKMCGRDR